MMVELLLLVVSENKASLSHNYYPEVWWNLLYSNTQAEILFWITNIHRQKLSRCTIQKCLLQKRKVLLGNHLAGFGIQDNTEVTDGTTTTLIHRKKTDNEELKYS